MGFTEGGDLYCACGTKLEKFTAMTLMAPRKMDGEAICVLVVTRSSNPFSDGCLGGGSEDIPTRKAHATDIM